MSEERRDNKYEDIFSDSTHEINTPVASKIENTGRTVSHRKISAKTRKMWIVNTVTILVSVIFIFAGVACIYAYSSISRINYDTNETSKPKDNAASRSESETSVSSYVGTIPQKLKEDDSVLNILLFGADKKQGDEEFGRSDSMILVSINNTTGKLVMTSFLRDLWVSIPDRFEHRLNTSYALGGPALATETIEQSFGIEIDRYAVVDFESFTNIIDTLGGIDLKLTDEEIDYINWQCWKNKQVETRHEITAKAGIVHLNGRQALWYSRDRDSIGSDWDRTSRQRIVINTIMNDLKKSNIAQIMSIIYQVGPMIQTNLDKGEIVYLAQNALNYLSYKTEQLSVPDINGGNYDCPRIDGMDVVTILDWDLERQRIQNKIYGVAGSTSSSSD